MRETQFTVLTDSLRQLIFALEEQAHGAGGTTKVALSLLLGKDKPPAAVRKDSGPLKKAIMSKTASIIPHMNIEDLVHASQQVAGQGHGSSGANLPQIYPQASLQNLQELNVNLLTNQMSKQNSTDDISPKMEGEEGLLGGTLAQENQSEAANPNLSLPDIN